MRTITEDDINALIKKGEEHNYKAKSSRDNNIARVKKIRERLALLPEDDFTSDDKQVEYSLLKTKIEAFLDKGTFTPQEIEEVDREIQQLLNYVYDDLEGKINEASYKS